MLIVLLGVAAMAIDLGWLFWQSIEIQHGTDAATLSGVVYEPDFRTEAHTEALTAALENGFDDGASGTTVSVLDYIDDNTAVANDSQLRVTVTHRVDTFFLKIFGLAHVDIARTAVAQYTPALLMGSPDDTFGRDYGPANHDPGFWANISGTYGPSGWGDRYASACRNKVYIDNTDYGTGYGLEDYYGDPCILTPEWRQSVNPGLASAQGGYLYGNEVPSGTFGLALEIFDGPLFAQRKFGKPAHQDDWTGDYWPDPSSWNDYQGLGPPDLDVTDDFITYFMLYGPDVTPLVTTDNELLCVVTYNAFNDAGSGQPADDDGGREQYYAWWDPNWSKFADVPTSDIENMWENMATEGGCGSLDRGPGIYPIRVMMQHIEPAGCPGLYDDGKGCPYGLNRFSLRVSASTGSPTISALSDMTIFANDVAWASTEFYLAKVEQKYAGKDLIVEFWDAGDFGGNPGAGDTVDIIAGNGDTLTCTWVVYDLDYNSDENGTGCSFDMESGGGSKYDNRIVQFTIPLPDSYACSGDACWFRVVYDYSGGTAIRDLTTWSAWIDGNPIRLVE